MIRNAYSAGRLDISVSSSSANAGGITGYQSGTSAVTEYCYSTMDVSGYYAGGIVGYHYGGSVNNCIALSETVSGRQFVNSYVGRVAARESAGAVKADNYAWTDMADSDGNVISTLLAGELTNKNGEDISSAEAADEKFWADLGFDSSIWKIETGSLPVLAGSDAEGVLPEHLRGDSAVELGGNGTVEAPYQISTTDDLVFAMQQINSDESYRSACFVLTADIDLSGISWQAIGTAGAPFTGTFDGGNHRISNLNLVVNAEYQGFLILFLPAFIRPHKISLPAQDCVSAPGSFMWVIFPSFINTIFFSRESASS